MARMVTVSSKSSAGWLAASGVAIYVAALPFETLFLVEEGVSLLRWLGAGLILLLSATILALGRVRKAGSIQWITVLMCFWAITSLTWSADSRAWLACTQLMFLASITLMIISAPWSHSEIKLISIAIAAGGAIAASASILRFSSGVEYLGYMPRASLGGAGMEQDPNYFAASLLLPLFTAIRLSKEGAIVLRLTSALAIPVLAIAILVSGSRGAVLGMIVGLLAAAMLMRAYRPRFIAFLAAGAILAGFTLPPLAPAVSERFSPTFNTLDQGGERLDIWAVGRTAALKSPLWGTGIGTFQHSFEAARPDTYGLQPLDSSRVSHSLPLGVAVELGAIGLLIWGSWVLAVCKCLWRSVSRDEFLIGALIAVLVSTLFLDAFTDRYYWVGLALLVAATLSADNNPHTQGAESPAFQETI